ncbi:hypothetical protein ACCI51_10905 [Microbulbifer echini]|uniref:Uncharacterized protein n=1 Tax=Microbulbifer echini TaxID=1529067 RepID=A0ABV4NNY7_9GAMM
MDAEKKNQFPKAIGLSLFIVGSVISAIPLFILQDVMALWGVLFSMLGVFIILPTFSLIVGGVFKLRDRSFNLWYAYFWGVAIAIFLSVKRLFS